MRLPNKRTTATIDYEGIYLAKTDSKPGKRLGQTKSKKHAKQSPPPAPAFAGELGGKLTDLDDHLYHILSCYYFYQASTAALLPENRENSDILLLGLVLTGNWLAEQSEAVMEELEAVREWVEEQG